MHFATLWPSTFQVDECHGFFTDSAGDRNLLQEIFHVLFCKSIICFSNNLQKSKVPGLCRSTVLVLSNSLFAVILYMGSPVLHWWMGKGIPLRAENSLTFIRSNLSIGTYIYTGIRYCTSSKDRKSGKRYYYQ
jgi:hypothetical protein